MVERRCPNCSLVISSPQEVILARFAMPTRIDEYEVKPGDDRGRPEIFHASCLPLGWLLVDGPMALDKALERVR
jgi:rRNA pseudouridine-1189 N-methylase Emg1 (Nep1/Mra1 family)